MINRDNLAVLLLLSAAIGLGILILMAALAWIYDHDVHSL